MSVTPALPTGVRRYSAGPFREPPGVRVVRSSTAWSYGPSSAV
ncbi:hypothetical protein [Streptomyces caniferus]